MNYEELQKEVQKIEKKRKEVAKSFGKVLVNTLKDVQTETGALKVRWTQYTPYFNDGSPCVFEVYTPELLVPKENSKQVYYYEYSDSDRVEGDNVWVDLRTYNEEAFELAPPSLKKLNRMFTELEPDYFKQLLDDHVQVTFDGKNLEVEDYSHD